MQYTFYATIINENEKIILNFNGKHESDEYKWFKLTDLPDKTLDKKEAKRLKL